MAGNGEIFMNGGAANKKHIGDELMEVRQLILENQCLQDKYPDKRLELQLGLKSLMELESEMIAALDKKVI